MSTVCFAPTTHDYASTQLNLPDSMRNAICGWAIKNIPDSDLTVDAYEFDSHITVKYGIDGLQLTLLRQLLADQPPIEVKMLAMSLFRSDEHEVLIIPIDSPALHTLNQLISNNLDCVDTYPTYIPHCTVAYLKVGHGDRYEGCDVFEDCFFTLDTLTYSKKNEDTVNIKLRKRASFSDTGQEGDVTCITINGVHIPIKHGEDRQEKIKSYLAKNPHEDKGESNEIGSLDEPDVQSKKMFDRSNHEPVTHLDNASSGAMKSAEMQQHLFGRQLNSHELMDIVGAPSYAKTTVATAGSDGLVISWDVPKSKLPNNHYQNPGTASALRVVTKDDDGNLAMINHFLDIQKSGRGKGVRIFAKQVKSAMELGITKIKTSASGSAEDEHYNGYYTWAKLGYNLEIPNHLREQAKKSGFGDVTNTHELFSEPGGIQWWRENGHEAEGIFDLTPGSDSLKMLHGYMKAKGISV
jgi:hypothetical protein